MAGKLLRCDGIIERGGFATTLEVHINLFRIFEFLVNLEGFVGAVDLIPIDPGNDIAILQSNFCIQRFGTNAESLKPMDWPPSNAGTTRA